MNFLKNKFVKILFTSIPPTWFTFYSVFATDIPFLYNNGKYTLFANIINILMLLALIFYAVALVLIDEHDKKEKIQEEKLFNSIMYHIDNIGIFTKTKQVEDYYGDGSGNSLSDYKSTMLHVLSSAVQCLADITTITRDKFVATYFYKFNGNWFCITSDGVHKGLTIDILKTEGSTFGQLLKDEITLLYFNKEDAVKENKYFPDFRDEMQANLGLPMGSIVGINCNLLNPFNDNEKYEHLFFISTYGEMLCTVKNQKQTAILVDKILRIFSHQINLLVLNFLKNNSKKPKA